MSRIEDVSVPGIVNPNEAVGIKDSPDTVAMSVSPPPGIGATRDGAAAWKRTWPAREA